MKQPAFQFYTGDWKKDPELSMCSPATRGIWMDAMCAMHDAGGTGQITGTPEQLARICRCSTAEMVCAIEEISATKTGNVTKRDGIVTLTNRRMKKAHDATVSARDRKRKQRGTPEDSGNVTDCPENVTSLSSDIEYSSSSSPSVIPPVGPPENPAAAAACDTPPESEPDHPPPPEPDSPSVLAFPCDGPAKVWHLTEAQVARFAELFPKLEIVPVCRKALAWIEADHSRRKTGKGMLRFLTAWITRENDSAPRASPSGFPPPRQSGPMRPTADHSAPQGATDDLPY